MVYITKKDRINIINYYLKNIDMLLKNKYNNNILDFSNCNEIKDYQKKYDDFKYKISDNNYEIILGFINIWIGNYGYAIKAFSEFKKIPQDKILNNNEYNRSILNKYKDKINKYFELDTDDDDSDYDDYETKEMYNKCIEMFYNKNKNNDKLSLKKPKKNKKKKENKENDDSYSSDDVISDNDNIDNDENNDNNDDKEKGEKYDIIHFLRKVLNKLDYSFIRKKYTDKYYYYISKNI